MILDTTIISISIFVRHLKNLPKLLKFHFVTLQPLLEEPLIIIGEGTWLEPYNHVVIFVNDYSAKNLIVYRLTWLFARRSLSLAVSMRVVRVALYETIIHVVTNNIA
jgi:hypothetical protein